MFHSGVVIFGTSLNSHLQPKAIAERTGDDGVEECKGFSPLMSTRQALRQLDCVSAPWI